MCSGWKWIWPWLLLSTTVYFIIVCRLLDCLCLDPWCSVITDLLTVSIIRDSVALSSWTTLLVFCHHGHLLAFCHHVLSCQSFVSVDSLIGSGMIPHIGLLWTAQPVPHPTALRVSCVYSLPWICVLLWHCLVVDTSVIFLWFQASEVSEF
jgi:hypothetical protein